MTVRTGCVADTSSSRDGPRRRSTWPSRPSLPRSSRRSFCSMLRLSRTHCESRPRRRPESMRNRAVLSAILADRRRALGLSQKDLAGSEVSASYVSLLEAGKRWPTEEVLTALARRLGTTATALLAGQDGPARTAEQRRLDLQWGQLALQSGQAASAEARAQGLLEDVLATTDEHLEAKALLAAAVELQGRPHEAIGILEPLVEELQQSSWQSLWSSTHLALCRCYRDVGDYAHAIDLGERAMRASKHLPAEETALGRASCRERVRQAVAGGAVPRKPAHTSRLR